MKLEKIIEHLVNIVLLIGLLLYGGLLVIIGAVLMSYGLVYVFGFPESLLIPLLIFNAIFLTIIFFKWIMEEEVK